MKHVPGQRKMPRLRAFTVYFHEQTLLRRFSEISRKNRELRYQQKVKASALTRVAPRKTSVPAHMAGVEVFLCHFPYIRRNYRCQ